MLDGDAMSDLEIEEDDEAGTDGITCLSTSSGALEMCKRLL